MDAGFGRIEDWNDARGFGFLTPEAAAAGVPARVFFHIRDYDLAGDRPAIGMRVRYTPQRQPDGRWRAVRVAGVGAAAPRQRAPMVPRARVRDARAPAGYAGRLGLGLALTVWCVLLGIGLASTRVPALALNALAGLNVLTFVAYVMDKHAARRGRWRTPESQLHLLELLGGWPAAALAQRMLRHKSAKPAYRQAFIAMIALHLLALGMWTFA